MSDFGEGTDIGIAKENARLSLIRENLQIVRIQKKLGESGDMIQTVIGAGYRIKEQSTIVKSEKISEPVTKFQSKSIQLKECEVILGQSNRISSRERSSGWFETGR